MGVTISGRTDLLLAAVEIIAIALIFTSFMTWIRFDSTEVFLGGAPHSTSTEITGDDLTGATDLGDGVVTAVAGSLAAVFAIASRFAAGSRAILAAGVAIAGLTACGVATYDIFKDWVSGTGVIVAVEVDVTLYAAMMITAVLGLAQGLAGLALLLMAQRAVETERIAATTDDSGEAETWA